MRNPKFSSGTATNWSNKSAKGTFTLHGDPEIKIEKPHTIIEFPGGSVEISRTSDNQYWVHVAVNHPDSSHDNHGTITDARVDVHNDHASIERGAPLMNPDINHLAILIRPQGS